MALQNFVDFVGPKIAASWLNVVDGLKETVFANAGTKAAARTALTSDAPLEVANGGTGARGISYFDARRYGLSVSASATSNSASLQSACDAAETAGGGVVFIPSGTYSTNAPIIVRAGVHILGEDQYSTIIKKTTSTASTITDVTVRFWDSATVGFPICVFHFVEGAATGWSGTCRNIQVQGDTSSPNTTVVDYGFFFAGMSNGRVLNCVAQYVKVGYFWGNASTIYSEIASNVAANVQRGFYQHFATSTLMHNNFASNVRFAGYYWSAHYSSLLNNACDAGGGTWKVGTTEICLAYEIKSCRGGSVKNNGCETHNGSVWKLNGNIATEFAHNTAEEVTSNYTGVSDIVGLELLNNIRLSCHDNVCNITAMTGTAARHFTTKIGTEFAPYTYARNFFVDVINQTTNSSTFWTNSSGTIQEEYESGTFTITLTGIAGADPTGTARYERYRDKVNLYIPQLTGTSDATTATLTGMPASIRPARDRRAFVRVADNSVVNEGIATIASSGIITLLYGPTELAWTAAGIKTIYPVDLNYGLT